jgi:flagellin-like hook-associated protein FlgL
MNLTLYGASQQFLVDLQRTQTQIQDATAQLSSGHRLQRVADDPSAIAQIYQLQAEVTLNQQTQANLSGASAELSAADTALQSAIAGIQIAISLAAQGASSTSSVQARANLAIQVQGLQQTLVGLSQAQVGNHYIFSGDLPTQPSYQLDPTQPEGVAQLQSASATHVIYDTNGTAIATTLTAQHIFDPKDSLGNPVAGNTFAAINRLLTALSNNDVSGIASAATSLLASSDYLNNQLVFYGDAANRVTNATSLAQKFLVLEQGSLGELQDANIVAIALAQTQALNQQQAALSLEAKINQMPTLFSLLG